MIFISTHFHLHNSSYSSFFTMGPVFLLVLDVDVEAKIAMMYPELYKELQKGALINFQIDFTLLL